MRHITHVFSLFKSTLSFVYLHFTLALVNVHSKPHLLNVRVQGLHCACVLLVLIMTSVYIRVATGHTSWESPCMQKYCLCISTEARFYLWTALQALYLVDPRHKPRHCLTQPLYHNSCQLQNSVWQSLQLPHHSHPLQLMPLILTALSSS